MSAVVGLFVWALSAAPLAQFDWFEYRVPLGGLENMSFPARRQQHQAFDASTELELPPPGAALREGAAPIKLRIAVTPGLAPDRLTPPFRAAFLRPARFGQFLEQPTQAPVALVAP